ncbi:M56 family metallopeptidase [Carboxylicivirga sp. N1Y90]|uniref:M56 family metallopeptidase n=1 Tax=Carboxylicivirga fragile TaxID=3417571 RepID=UPI003D34C18F|nr:hypothetical protein [Marinilabiliaceae bacterium N1Y90]
MAKFLLYLFESGLCLSIFYLGYVVFFRKETYFTFNRFYLLGSMLLALTIPLISIQMDVVNYEYIKDTSQGIEKFKSYYEHLILITDPEFIDEVETSNLAVDQSNVIPLDQVKSDTAKSSNSWKISSIIFIIYFIGVLFFTFRFLFLLRSLRRIIKQNTSSETDGINLIYLKEEMPSFSFLNWVFVNKEILKNEEFEQVLEHEKVHVNDKHSVDLILAQIITIFQWFNPLTWRIQKSIKTCHEYIADRQVVNKGHELFDYQSLLLSQLISIRSVELVNNFNLLSIKKRIAMMNKNKSGLLAKMKAVAIVPILIAAFFLFADMTSRSNEVMASNKATVSNSLNGDWMSVNSQSGQAQLLVIRDNKLTTMILDSENVINSIVYDVKIKSKNFILIDGKEKQKVNYEFENEELIINWDEEAIVTYRKAPKGESYIVLDANFQKLTYPKVTELKQYRKDMILMHLFLSGEELFFEGKRRDFSDLDAICKNIEKPESSKLNRMTTLLEIDKEVLMVYVDKVKQALRENNYLKIGYVAKHEDKAQNETDLALFMLLPPMDAEFLEKSELADRGINLFTIDGSKAIDKNLLTKKLKKHILSNEKYVMLYEYENATSYNDYLTTVNTVFATVNSIRRDYCEKQGDDYDKMSSEEQRKIRKKYPITLTKRNIDTE